MQIEQTAQELSEAFTPLELAQMYLEIRAILERLNNALDNSNKDTSTRH